MSDEENTTTNKENEGDDEEKITFTREEEKIYNEIFSSLDTHKRNWIPAAQIGYALRLNGQCPTEEEISTIVKSCINEDRPGDEPRINHDDFQVLMKQFTKSREQLYAMIDEAFQQFDPKDSGLIDESELRSALANLGEPLEDTEVKEFMRDAKVSTDGKVSYSDFAKHLVESFNRPASKKKSGKKSASASAKGKKKKK